ncbi:bifunctional serine/threonine-protein kinase/formylglycine-generating enzyme family protein [Sorangium sp. So ce429]
MLANLRLTGAMETTAWAVGTGSLIIRPALTDAEAEPFSGATGRCKVRPMQLDPPELDRKRSAESLLGSNIGQYLIAEEIGRGGMGVVYRAVHQGVGQVAAVKVLSSQLARDASYLRRFTNEARALSLVDHPGLVKIFDFGETPRGEPYILMEYLRGELLRSRLARCKKLALPEVLRIGRQAATALAAVHQSGIVHRDLKPSNMMLVADDEASGGERLKLLDFGIARFADDGTDLTAPGSVLGTAMYMSPEQCAGQSPVDGRSDVYSLGVVLYELLAGELPFKGEPVEVLRMHLFRDPPPLEAVAPEMPHDIARIIRRMLAKEPSLRPDIAQIAEAMRRDSAVVPPAAGASAKAAASAPAGASPEEPAGRTTQKKAVVRASTTRVKLSRPGGAQLAGEAGIAPSEADPPPDPAADRPERGDIVVEPVQESERAELSARPQRLRLVRMLAVPVLLATVSYALGRACNGSVDSGPVKAALLESLPIKAVLLKSAPVKTAPVKNAPVPLSNMVRLAGGKFRMGSTPAEVEAECQRLGPACRRDLLEREQPAREVTVSPFYIDAHEVTNAEFAAWLELLGPTLKVRKDSDHGTVRYVYHPAENDRVPGILLVDISPPNSGLLYNTGNHFAPRQGLERKPIVQVTWDAASLYCKARGKRLPTEAEWEFAARGTTSRRFPWGEEPPRCDKVALDRYGNGACRGVSEEAQDVGTAPQDRTPEGVWDLGGNVEEWVQDQFLLPYYPTCGECIDPVVEATTMSLVDDVRVRRGGAWSLPDTTSRGVARGRWKRGEVLAGVGFRCASR